MKANPNCPCKNMNCKIHGQCAECVIKHNSAGQLPECIFPNHDGDRTQKNFYLKLKEKFEQ